jgi:UDP:flavonoid glycosyltransferase YjiC (YdhE family)
MRILLAGYGTRGDVQPLVAIGSRLRADGHEVVIGASPTFAGWVRGHGLEFHPIGADIEPLVRSLGDELARRPVLLMGRLLESLREEIDLSFDQTVEAARGADLIVAGVHTAAPSVAEALGLPYRTLLFCPQILPSSHHPPLGIPWLALPRSCNRLLWWGLDRAFDGALGKALNRHRRRQGLAPVAHLMPYLLTERPIVASDALLGALPPDVAPGIEQVGSLVLADDGVIDPALGRFLEQGSPPVCIGFGSMPDGDPRRTTRTLIEALEMCGRRGVIISGWAGLGEGALSDAVFVTRSAPHGPLLPRVAALVHHGGAGTTAAAARAGIPQVVVPHFVDQYYWAHQMCVRGLASRPIRRGSLTAARLARALDDVLLRPEVAERARVVRSGLALTDGVSALAERLYEAAGESAREIRADRMAA